MIKIQNLNDVEKIENSHIYNYTQKLLEHLLKTYGVNDIEKFGAIFYIENDNELLNHNELCLSSPLTEQRFEWIEDIGEGYVNGCIVINNDHAIDLIGKSEYFTKHIVKEQ
ncbi:MAG: hypothetical protein IJ944_03930 [Clostridia bacterium]|nr:hypothetical protein [Clostridia bacterium]